ncbi:NADH-quinone oxidoreductase subunit C [SAR202 cluster bacterium AD-802-E10_MRT_200m]|nr:NADH-quinone oxidoreductase subunit C [SAR202 cluster bacterium AD-802-E10_MRT_200m]
MTKLLSGEKLGQFLKDAVPGSLCEIQDQSVVVNPEFIATSCQNLKADLEFAMNYLVSITCVDYLECFEIIYHMTSISLNQSGVLRTRIFSRDEPQLPSVVEVWRGADFQEREIWDLMGIKFRGHPNLKRILTWEGFDGHPLQKTHLGG